MDNKEKELLSLTTELEKSYARWDTLYREGGSDPFWPDGMGLNLVRNHMIGYKARIHSLIEGNQEELTLFPLNYPEIWHKELPPEVDGDYMAKPDAIRKRALEQLELYNADPNYLYLLEVAPAVYTPSKTKEVKEAGVYFYEAIGLTKYKRTVEEDDLVGMRRVFRESYENKALRWADYAAKIRTFLDKVSLVSDSWTSQSDSSALAPSCDKNDLPSVIDDESTKTALAEQRRPLSVLLEEACNRTVPSKAEGSKQNVEQLELF